jgi:Ca2+-binding RTX toxin-like protein
VAAALGTFLAFPATAPAADVARLLGSNAVSLSAVAGEVNEVTVAHAGSEFVFTDASATIIAGTGCSQIGPQEVRCPSTAADAVLAFLSDGDDRLTSTTGFPTLVCGGFGNDTVQTGVGPDGIWGEEGNDSLSGGGERDLIFGETRCSGPPTGVLPGNDTLAGEEGNDILEGGSGSDSVLGGSGEDFLLGLEGADSLDGGDGADDVLGYEGDDALSGGTGDDRLAGGEGNDSEAGGVGADVLAVTHVDSGVVHFDEGDDVLDGGPGDDTLNGGPGGSFLLFGEPAVAAFESDVSNGSDNFRGGEGSDAVSYTNRSAAVAVSYNGAADDGSTDERDLVREDVESVQGGSGNDQLSGRPGPDTLDGGRGADRVEGGDGDDVLSGGAEDGGADRLLGGSGADALQGDAGADALTGGPGGDTLAGGGGSDTIAGEEGADSVTGGTGLDSISGGLGDDTLDGSQPVLVGADGADRIAGDAGEDSLVGGPGDDTLAGGSGPDVISGGAGIDSADYRGARRAVTVTLDGSANDGEPGEHDDVRADVEGVRGGEEEDTQTGNPSSNPLVGGPGEDYIDGAGGSDDLRGGNGRDAIRARDGLRDAVRCGAAADFVIVDRDDVVRSDCELVDRGGRPTPVLGRRIAVRPLRGSLTVRLPGRQRTVPLEDTVSLPLPSALDTRRGAVRVTAALGELRRTSATLRGGRVLVRQRRVRRAPTGLRVLRPQRSRCRRGSRGRPLARVTVSSPGGFRTRGRLASATGRHATWLTEERCNGTRVRASRGRVLVVDLGSERRVILRAGESHFARAR